METRQPTPVQSREQANTHRLEERITPRITPRHTTPAVGVCVCVCWFRKAAWGCGSQAKPPEGMAVPSPGRVRCTRHTAIYLLTNYILELVYIYIGQSGQVNLSLSEASQANLSLSEGGLHG
jgi:hypothetical protein